ncbi:MAG: FAD-dependent monooxygenase [Ottowia sp.]|nr:FAD-dependent monooxygenase [Ottowia sp.]
MAAPHDVCIRGAGIVGRTLALLLARQGLRVALVAPAQYTRRDADVRAYAISPQNQQLLADLRCWLPEADATPVRSMVIYGDRRGVVHFDADRLKVQALNWIVDVPALEQRLAEACSYQGALETVDAPVPAPLTVICEGRASRTRAELGVEFESIAYNQHAVATRLDCEQSHGQVARQWFTLDGEILAFLPLAGPAGHEVAVVWAARPAQARAAAGWTDAELAAHLHELSGGALGALEVRGARGSWPLIVGQATRWVGAMPGAPNQSFALAGDAAHAMHPLAGQGLNTGLGDVAELAAVLAAREDWRPLHDRRLLRRYARARQGDWQRMRWATDGLQQLFTHPAPLAAALRNRGMTLFDYSGPLKHRVARLAMGDARP